MTIPTPEFWDEEARRLWDELAPISARIVTAGGMAGADALPVVARILMNWDTFNTAAIEYLNKYKLSWVAGIGDHTRKTAIAEIEAWIEAGEALSTLEARLMPLFGSTRAAQIAVTEVTRLYSDGNQMAWTATGIVSGKRWMTRNNEFVCPLCGPLHGELVELDDIFIQTPTDIANSPQMQALYADAYDKALAKAASLLRYSGAYVGGPPRHVGCYCWLNPFVSEELFREQLRQSFGSFGDLEIAEAVAELRAWRPKINIRFYDAD